MPDNVLLNLGTGGETLATDDIGGVQYQIIKVTYGALDAQTLASSGNGTTDAGTQRVTLSSDSTGQVALAAGTNGIGKLTANSGVDIGDVDVTSLIPGTGSTSLGKAEGAAHVSGDTGVMGLSIRSDTLGPLGANGQYTPQQVDDLGAVYANQGNRISADGVNSRAKSTLAASATFQGTSEDVSKYGRVGVSITSSNATDGVLTMEVSRDNIDFGGPTRTWADTRFAQPHMWNIVEKYFRIKYVNGTTEALDLQIQVQYSNNANILLGHQLDETLIPETEAIVTRSVSVGQDPNDVFVNEETSGVDDDNSSIINLTSGTSLVFTGTFHDISGYTGLTVLVDGTTSGSAVSGTLQMQFSHDGSTVHRNISVTTTDVRDTLPRTLGVVAQFFRIIYTSDADLVSFDVQTMLHTQQVMLVSRLDSTLQGSDDVTIVRSVIAGQTAGGSFVNVGVTNGGSLKQDLTEINGTAPDVNSGNVSAGSQRITIATDDVNQAAINAATAAIQTAVELLDNAVSGAGYNITQLGGINVSLNTGVRDTGTQRVTVATDDLVPVSGTITADAGTGTFTSAGDIAHDTADSGSPLKIGGKAKNFDGTPAGTDVAEDDRVDAYYTVDGRQYVETAHPNHFSVSADYASSQTNTTVQAAPGAGLKLYITDIIISNGATAGNITLLDGSGGTVKFEIYPAINGGATHSFSTPIALTSNTLLAITSTLVTTHSITISGFTAA